MDTSCIIDWSIDTKLFMFIIFIVAFIFFYELQKNIIRLNYATHIITKLLTSILNAIKIAIYNISNVISQIKYIIICIAVMVNMLMWMYNKC